MTCNSTVNVDAVYATLCVWRLAEKKLTKTDIGAFVLNIGHKLVTVVIQNKNI